MSLKKFLFLSLFLSFPPSLTYVYLLPGAPSCHGPDIDGREEKGQARQTDKTEITASAFVFSLIVAFGKEEGWLAGSLRNWLKGSLI